MHMHRQRRAVSAASIPAYTAILPARHVYHRRPRMSDRASTSLQLHCVAMPSTHPSRVRAADSGAEAAADRQGAKTLLARCWRRHMTSPWHRLLDILTAQMCASCRQDAVVDGPSCAFAVQCWVHRPPVIRESRRRDGDGRPSQRAQPRIHGRRLCVGSCMALGLAPEAGAASISAVAVSDMNLMCLCAASR